ncbi:MAG: type II secretion system protein GspN [Oligoflexales bacterium]|nr:type II secretion system protein GspN [Oligoflexales bacterium]
MKEKLAKFLNHFGYVFLFIFSFIFFLYFTFPYGVLKEAVTSQIKKSTDLTIRVEELSPSFPLGFDLKKIEVLATPSAKPLEFQRALVKISVLNLLIGRISADLTVKTKDKGYINIVVRFGIFNLIFKKLFIPSAVILESENFEIRDPINFVLALKASSPTMNPLVSGLLPQIDISGKFAGELRLDLDPSNLSESSGNVDLQIKNAILKLNNKTLLVKDQVFKKAVIKAKMANGDLSIAKVSGFHTEELQVDFDGNVTLKKQILKSVLNVSLNVVLQNDLKEKFSLILNAVGGSNGQLKYQIRGTFDNPNYVSI